MGGCARGGSGPSLLLPVVSGIVLALCAWGPFLWFEANRKWLDLKTIADASDKCLPVGAKVDDRYTALRFALSHLGQSQHGPVHLTRVISALVLLAIVMALARRRLRDPGFALPAAMLAFGVAVQVAVDQGERTDVLMLWLVPLYALAAWAVVQTVEVVRPAFARRAVVPSIVVVVSWHSSQLLEPSTSPIRSAPPRTTSNSAKHGEPPAEKRPSITTRVSTPLYLRTASTCRAIRPMTGDRRSGTSRRCSTLAAGSRPPKRAARSAHACNHHANEPRSPPAGSTSRSSIRSPHPLDYHVTRGANLRHCDKRGSHESNDSRIARAIHRGRINLAHGGRRGDGAGRDAGSVDSCRLDLFP